MSEINKKNLVTKKFEEVLENFLERSNVLENIHQAKLLQPITAHVDSA